MTSDPASPTEQCRVTSSGCWRPRDRPGRPGGNQDDVCVTDGIGSTGHGSGGQVKLVASPGREGFTVLRCRTVDTHAAGAPNRCQRPQLRPRLAAAANDANNLGFRSGEGVSGDGAQRACAPCSDLVADHYTGQRPALVPDRDHLIARVVAHAVCPEAASPPS